MGKESANHTETWREREAPKPTAMEKDNRNLFMPSTVVEEERRVRKM